MVEPPRTNLEKLEKPVEPAIGSGTERLTTDGVPPCFFRDDFRRLLSKEKLKRKFLSAVAWISLALQ